MDFALIQHAVQRSASFPTHFWTRPSTSTCRGKRLARAGTEAAQLGILHYGDNLRTLRHLIQNLPSTIPLADDHNFLSYEIDQERLDDYGSNQSVVNRDLESRGPGLEAVVDVLRDYITGSKGQNLLLTKWVDDLTESAQKIIDASGEKLPRLSKLTAGKRLMEEEAQVEKSEKHKKKQKKAVSEQAAKIAEQAKKLTAQGKISHAFDDLSDDEDEGARQAGGGQGRSTDPSLDRVVISCHTKSTGKKRRRCSGPRRHELLQLRANELKPSS
ncbi:hypothetical protein C8J56DRAFT_1032134 [Mycena floridula]|nr:hypothetical protein C8J56DRAFT_1032134 [Mycena floridula]